MKRIVSVAFSRAFVVAVAIGLQFFWIYWTIYDASVRYQYVSTIVHFLALFLVFVIVNKWINPYYKLAWAITILAFPLFGIVLYATFGRSELTKRTQKRMDAVHKEILAYLKKDTAAAEDLLAVDPGVAKQSRYINDRAQFPLYRHSETVYYPSGEEMFAAMMEAIAQAEKFIFLEYFIIEDGVMLSAMMDVLVQKAKEGVTIRFLYDDVGSVQTLPHRFAARLKQAGIACASFNPFRPILSIILNNRDHRKILVVDGRIGFTGGINIADEYINQKKRFGYWKDAGVRVKGEAVRSFTMMFLEMWNYINRTSEDYQHYLPAIYDREDNPADGFVQPYSDTPLDHENVGENIYLNLINHAKRYVYIFTPYLIVDHEMTVALQNAAKCGVDVRIVTPGIPDKKLIFLLTQSYYGQFIQNGVRIYQYTPGFLHAKCFVCDDEAAVVGTVNLDYRSLYLHFECGVFLYRSQAVMQLKQDALDSMEKSQEITPSFCRKRSLFIRMAQSVLRLFAPLL